MSKEYNDQEIRVGKSPKLKESFNGQINHNSAAKNMNMSEIISLAWDAKEILRGDFKKNKWGEIILPFVVLTREESTVLVDALQHRGLLTSTQMPCSNSISTLSLHCPGLMIETW
jgi:hypothetical protein